MNSKPKKICTVVGARPQFVKCAVLRHALSETPNINEVLIHTGQHYDHLMSNVFFEQLTIRPAEHHLELENRKHGAMTGEMMGGIERIFEDEQPDLCLVYGDTNSTLAGALVASKMHIPVCHVEAGLRSFNRAMPEEINRILTDHVSELLFCSTEESVKNLKDENVRDGVFLVGDIMFDAVKMFAPKGDGETVRKSFGLSQA
ncbi:MAG: UDP-N-acetylglucosamine 2-epimerase, partial [Pseudomonadota bacterium]